MKKIKKSVVTDPLSVSLSKVEVRANETQEITTVKPSISSLEFIILFGLIMSLTALTISALVPAMHDIQKSLSLVDIRSTQLIVSLFIFGMVFGELIFGPIADAIGRKPVITIGIIIYLIGSLVAMFSHSLTWLLIGRVIQGVGVSGPKIGARALVRDCFKGDAMARVMSFMMMMLILMPMLAPILGQWILLHFSWRVIFLLFLFMSIVLWTWVSIRQNETLKPAYKQPISWLRLRLNFTKISRHSFVMCCTLIAGLTFGAHMAFINTAQSIFQDIFKQSNDFVYTFSLLALFSGIASFINGKLVLKIGMMKLTLTAFILIILAMLFALIYQLISQLALPFTLFLCVFSVVFFAVGLIFGNMNSMAMQYCGAVAGTASSVISSLSSLVAVIVSIAVGRFYQFTITPLIMTYLIISIVSLWLLCGMKNKKFEDIR